MPEPIGATAAREGSDPAPPDDTEALTAAIARGDTRAFGVLYERWFGRVFAAARAVTGRDESFCLDVAQDAMLKAAKRVPRLRDETALSRWLCRVTHNAALDRLRAEKRRARREAGPPQTPGECARPDDERIAWLAARVRELSAEDQGLLRARFLRGRTLGQVGEEIGVSPDAAHGRLRRLIDRLRESARD